MSDRSSVQSRAGLRPAPQRRLTTWLLAFVLVGFFIWIAENIATFLGAWQYPHQAAAWAPVHLQKVGSWSLLVILSFIIVAQLKHVKARLRAGGQA